MPTTRYQHCAARKPWPDLDMECDKIAGHEGRHYDLAYGTHFDVPESDESGPGA
jgi:hypothetical protein